MQTVINLIFELRIGYLLLLTLATFFHGSFSCKYLFPFLAQINHFKQCIPEFKFFN